MMSQNSPESRACHHSPVLCSSYLLESYPGVQYASHQRAVALLACHPSVGVACFHLCLMFLLKTSLWAFVYLVTILGVSVCISVFLSLSFSVSVVCKWICACVCVGVSSPERWKAEDHMLCSSRPQQTASSQGSTIRIARWLRASWRFTWTTCLVKYLPSWAHA